MKLQVGRKALTLGKSIGKGGEGEVFDIGEGLAAKIYFKPDASRHAKIAAMIGSKLFERTDLIAFPREIVTNSKGDFVGFTMRKVAKHTPFHQLHAPGSRKIHFPKADYRFTIRAAANIARSVAQVHDANVVIGDINESGILISDQATVALIDADSFQFGPKHLCRVGKSEYTPPELQGKRLDGIVRTSNHDAFGLSVLIFQLLFMGRHPFVGRYSRGDMPTEKAIAEHRFVYSNKRDVQMASPPGACRLEDFPPQIGETFERAFSPNSSDRPTASEWVKVLGSLEASLSKCRDNELHYYPSAAAECLWCRMERQIGILLYLPSFTLGGGSPAVDPGAAGFNLGQIWAAIQSVKIPDPQGLKPLTVEASMSPSSEAKAAKSEVGRKKFIGFVSTVAAGAVAFVEPGLWFIYGALGWFGLARLFGDVRPDNSATFTDKYQRHQGDLAQVLENWRKRMGVEELHALKSSLHDAHKNLSALPQLERDMLASFENNRRDVQLHTFLEKYPIRRAKIRGIGPSKIATLSSYGIDTAADVVQNRVVAVPGFGAVSAVPLIQWRQRIASRFVFQQAYTPEELAEMSRIKQSCASKASNYRAALRKGASDLPAFAAKINAVVNQKDPVVDRAMHMLAQAKADLEYLSLPIPAQTVIPKSASPVPIPTQPRSTPSRPKSVASKSGVSCPTCGGRMVRRQARRGYNAGGYFYGCAAYPRCRGTRSI